MSVILHTHGMLISNSTASWTKKIACKVYVRVLLFSVDFDGGDCSREFTVSKYDVYYLKADPNPLTSGGAASCTVRFRTSSAFNIYVQSVHVQDCTAKLFFYDNDNTQKYPSVCPVMAAFWRFLKLLTVKRSNHMVLTHNLLSPNLSI